VTGVPEAEARLQREIDRCPYHELLRPEAVQADGEVVVVRLPFRRELGLARDRDHFHGGVVAGLVDLAAHAVVAVATGTVAPTVDLRVDFLRPAPAPELVARATLIRQGRSFSRADVEVLDHAGRLVTQGRGVFSTGRGEPG
jgi:uncharacterized protein (TIGR00369 family)